LTWEITLEGEFAHNFAFDSLTQAVYVTTDNGLYKSPDYGETWAVFPTIQDAGTGEMVYTTEVYSVGVVPGLSLWVGTADGLAMSRDDGLSWTLFRAFPVPGTGETPATYAYPNPFSPFRHNQIGGEGYVRFQYHVSRPGRVTVRVYDFAMKLVRTVSRDRARSFPGDYAEAWDGRNDVGEMVANGVYFYRIEIEGENPLWGKVMVVN
jgi:hypothetical protein